MKYLPLFHHFKVIYQFSKHIILFVKIVANAPLIQKNSTLPLTLLHYIGKSLTPYPIYDYTIHVLVTPIPFMITPYMC
jgi:hypothetical protein